MFCVEVYFVLCFLPLCTICDCVFVSIEEMDVGDTQPEALHVND